MVSAQNLEFSWHSGKEKKKNHGDKLDFLL